MQARKVNLFAVDRHAGDLREFEFDVDGSLREFTISVSGENPVITVINSRGIIQVVCFLISFNSCQLLINCIFEECIFKCASFLNMK